MSSVSARAIKLLANTVIAFMPKKQFTTPEVADKYMLTGDERFSYCQGEHFTCGFGKQILTPKDVEEKKYFIAGYDSNNPAQGVLDDMLARAVFIDDNTGRGGVVICAVDAVGLSRHDVNDIRRLVLESGRVQGIRSINICATHTHSAIDTQGLWGEKLYRSGRDEEYMCFFKAKTAEAIISAYENRKNGRLFYSVTETVDMQFDCRLPEAYDRNLTKIRFESFDGRENIQIINFASHAELMGSKTTKISADFPCYMIREIEEGNTNTNALFINGAIGGMISAREIKKVYRHELDCEQYTRDFGKALGEIANAVEAETEIKPVINVHSRSLKLRPENFALILMRFLGVLNNDVIRGKRRSEALISTELGYMELGDKQIGMFLIPGELFPELWNGEFLDEDESATGKNAEYDILKELCECEHSLVVGLCNDELGYIIPDNDFLTDEKMPYINNATDIHQRRHYEETNSTGPHTARVLLEETKSIIRKTGELK